MFQLIVNFQTSNPHAADFANGGHIVNRCNTAVQNKCLWINV